MDNGWETRRSLLGIATVRSALRSPFADRSPPRSHHRGLSEGLPRRVLLSVTGLLLFGCCGYYMRRAAICQPPFSRKFFRVKASEQGSRPPWTTALPIFSLPMQFAFSRSVFKLPSKIIFVFPVYFYASGRGLPVQPQYLLFFPVQQDNVYVPSRQLAVKDKLIGSASMESTHMPGPSSAGIQRCPVRPFARLKYV